MAGCDHQNGTYNLNSEEENGNRVQLRVKTKTTGGIRSFDVTIEF